MTDTKASYYQDYQDALNENARLRAEVHALRGSDKPSYQRLYDERADLRAENAKLRAELEAVKKREKDGVELFDGIVAELRAELAALRQQAEAAAPTDAEIEAWEKRAKHYLDLGAMRWVAPTDIIDQAVALMKRAQRAAPAASGALRDAAKRARERYREWERIPGAGVRDDIGRDNFIEAACKLMEACEALAAEPPAPSAAAGVAVPEDVRAAAEKLDSGDASLNDQARCASFILSLAAAAGASQPEPAAQGDAELQRLMDAFREEYQIHGEFTMSWSRLLHALARKAGAK